MIIVKLTVLLLLTTAIYTFLMIAFDGDYRPKCIGALNIMIVATIIGIFTSAIYLLFFR